MNNDQKPSRLAHVPAILAGSAALIAAVSTLYVNLRNEPSPPASPSELPASAAPPIADAAPAASVPAAPGQASEPQSMLLRLERVQVDDDGTVGTTDWNFQVSVDGKPYYLVAMPALSDEPGENLARPADAQAASAQIELPRGKIAQLEVNGWKKKGWLPGSRAEVSGSTPLGAGLRETTVALHTDKPKGPAFVVYFSLSPAR